MRYFLLVITYLFSSIVALEAFADDLHRIQLYGEPVKCRDKYPASRKYEKAFKNSKTDSCLACPKNYRRTAFTSELSKKACRKDDYTKYRKATKKASGKGFGGLKCPKGQYLRLKNRSCYTCPRGYKRSGRSLADKKACKKHVEPRSSAQRLGYEGCPAGTKLHIPSQVCYACPAGTKRKFTTKVDFNKRPRICEGTLITKPSRAQLAPALAFLDANPNLLSTISNVQNSMLENPNVFKTFGKSQNSFDRKVLGSSSRSNGFKGVIYNFVLQPIIRAISTVLTPLDSTKTSISISGAIDISSIGSGAGVETGLFFDNTGNINATAFGIQEENTYWFYGAQAWTKGLSSGGDVQANIGVWFADVSEFNGASWGHTLAGSYGYGASISVIFSPEWEKFLGFVVAPQIGISGEYEQFFAKTVVPKYEKSLED